MNLIIKEKEIEKIVLEYILKVRQIEEDSCRILKEQIVNLMSRVMLRVNQQLKNLEQAKRYDKLYFHVEDIRSRYDAYVKLVEANGHLLVDKHVRDIFFGIRDMAVDALETIPQRKDNPITYERMVLISAGILKIKQHYNEALENDQRQCSIGNQVTKESLLTYMNDYVMTFFEASIDQVQEELSGLLSLMTIQEESNKYKNFILDQAEELGSLEMLTLQNLSDGREEDASKQLVVDLAEQISELYYITKKIKETMDLEALAEVSPESIIAIEDIHEIVSEHIFGHSDEVRSLFARIDSEKEDSVNEIKAIISSEVNHQNIEINQQITRESSGYQLLSSQLVVVFGEAIHKFEALDVTYETQVGHAIAEGIITTMGLKLDSMREKDTEYQINKKNLNTELERELMQQKHSFLEQSADILEHALGGDDQTLHRLQQQFHNKVDQVKLRYKNFDMNYLKTDLLFELRTFEELVEHSLKKLIEHEPKSAKMMTDIMISTLERSRDILSSHRIEFIIPKEHEKFDGKYHEVMMAETTTGFAKGEIIKTTNIGYKLKDFVILRASVIAAK